MPIISNHPRSRGLYLQRIEKVIRYIDCNLAGPLDLDTLAREADFSPYHFHRIFSALTGETPQDFVNRLRLERGANLLVKSPALTITEIAFACGFSTSSAFTRSFKRHFGMPPGRYAAQNRIVGAVPPAWVSPRRPSTPDLISSLPPVQVRQMPALHMAYFVGTHGYAPDSIEKVWKRMFQWAAARRVLDGARVIAVCFDDPKITPPHKCRYYACLTIPPDLTSDPHAGFLDLPAHTCAVCHLDCDPEEIQPAYQTIYREWLPDSGFLLADLPPYEIYYSTPQVDPSSKYVFDLCIPLALP